MGAFEIVWMVGSGGVMWRGVRLENMMEGEMCKIVEEFEQED